MANDQVCSPCGKDSLNDYTMDLHVNSDAHKKTMTEKGYVLETSHDSMVEVVAPEYVMPSDLQRIIDDNNLNPTQRVKMVRAAFAVREWPNGSHPGSVKDFLDEYKIPYLPGSKGTTHAQSIIRRQQWEKEVRNGRH